MNAVATIPLSPGSLEEIIGNETKLKEYLRKLISNPFSIDPREVWKELIKNQFVPVTEEAQLSTKEYPLHTNHDTDLFAYFSDGNPNINHSIGYSIGLNLSKKEICVTHSIEPTMPLKTYLSKFRSIEAAYLAYILGGAALTKGCLKRNRLEADVVFDNLFRGLSVEHDISGQKFFVASYSGLEEPKKRYAVIGRNNDQNEWVVIQVNQEYDIQLIKSAIRKMGYGRAILLGDIKEMRSPGIDREVPEINRITHIPHEQKYRLNYQL